jgi:hypothetical protein
MKHEITPLSFVEKEVVRRYREALERGQFQEAYTVREAHPALTSVLDTERLRLRAAITDIVKQRVRKEMEDGF